MYVRVVRNGKPENCCFTDLTEAEQRNFLNSLDRHSLVVMSMVLADVLRGIAEELNLYRED